MEADDLPKACKRHAHGRRRAVRADDPSHVAGSLLELELSYGYENEEIRFRAEYGGEGGNVLENDTIPHARVCPRMGDFDILCFLTRRDQTSRAASTTQRMRS